MLGVVAPDAHHLAGEDRREQTHVGQGPPLAGVADLLERDLVDLGHRHGVDRSAGLALDHAERHATGMYETREPHALNLAP
jgi:hypothetical protein